MCVLRIHTIISIKSLLYVRSMIFFDRSLRYIITVDVCELQDISLVILEDMRFHASMEVCVCTSHTHYNLYKIPALCAIHKFF